MGRKIINISVPPELHGFVEIRVKNGCYGSVSEYFRELLKSDQRRERIKYEDSVRQNARLYGNRDKRTF